MLNISDYITKILHVITRLFARSFEFLLQVLSRHTTVVPHSKHRLLRVTLKIVTAYLFADFLSFNYIDII